MIDVRARRAHRSSSTQTRRFQDIAAMPRSVPVLARVRPKVKAKLKCLARDTQRTESFLAAEAITAYVEANAWQVEVIRKRLASVSDPKAGVLPHEDVGAWFMSLGTDRRRRKPKGRRLSEL
jgi:predicted transcriptional regulator